MSLTAMLTYPFMQRALIAGVLVSLCAALLGVSLVLKRYSMIGDGLSHVSFGALAVAVALGVTPLYFSIPVVILAAFFLLRLAVERAGNLRSVERYRHVGSFVYVRRAGDDLHRLLAADVHLAYDQLVGVGMLFNLVNAAYDHVFHLAAHVFHRLQVGAGHDHPVAELLGADVYIRIIF